ncbi:ParB-like nuclease domain protein [Mycobacterium phage Che12]|uniref:ParB-like nuclease domain protein n=1 Tax=Mycobacterium phage Che12 TaxID=2911435 RepID=Q1A0C7_9CAUD|nr:gp90 [Mycobacterium phage Che12]ABE67409.1 ParB-like nuclease domain protein [Mycobacterium phage Che12]
MTAALLDYDTLTVDEVSALDSNDVAGLCHVSSTVGESGKHLNEFYKENARSISPGTPAVKGKFWEKVGQVADILKRSDEWPFDPLTVRGTTLYDGHHRANAAILAGWSKPIPVSEQFFGW